MTLNLPKPKAWWCEEADCAACTGPHEQHEPLYLLPDVLHAVAERLRRHNCEGLVDTARESAVELVHAVLGRLADEFEREARETEHER